MEQNDEYSLRISHLRRFPAMQLGMPTGRVMDDNYYEVRVVSSTEPNSYNLSTITVRARPIMSFGAMANPSPEWVNKYLGQFYFILSYIEGSRQSATIVGYLPHRGSKLAKESNFGSRNTFGGLSNGVLVDDIEGQVSIHAQKHLGLTSSEAASLTAHDRVETSAGENKRVGLVSESGKNYLGATDTKPSSPMAKGDELKDFLESVLTLLQTAVSAGPGVPIVLNGQPATGSTDIIELRTKLNRLLSKTNFLE